MGYFAVKYLGLTWHDFSYDFSERTVETNIKLAHGFQQICHLWRSLIAGFHIALVFAHFIKLVTLLALFDIMRWLSRELPLNIYPQEPGDTFMDASEYRHLINDSVGFLHDAIFPRAAPGLGKPGTPQWTYS